MKLHILEKIEYWWWTIYGYNSTQSLDFCIEHSNNAKKEPLHADWFHEILDFFFGGGIGDFFGTLSKTFCVLQNHLLWLERKVWEKNS